jgi:pSer/pThr/pTyr-binding forkhead associated (FHA) protein
MDEFRNSRSAPDIGSQSVPRATLVVVHSAEVGEQGKRYPVGSEETTLGREPGNVIVVASDQASRRHARIFALGGTHMLEDLGSTNGTYLNSRLVKEEALRHGDVVRVASTVLKYLVDG